MCSENAVTEFDRNMGFRIRLTNTIFTDFPGILSRYVVVPNSMVLGTRQTTLVTTLLKTVGWLPQNLTPKTGPQMGGRNPAKMADFWAIFTIGMSLYVPLRKTTHERMATQLERPRLRVGRYHFITE